MKTVFTIIGVLVVAVLVIFLVSSRSADAPTDTATSSQATSSAEMEELEDGEYAVSSEDSTVEWQAEKSFVSGYEDSGFIPVESGTITVEGKTITAADITLDTASITATETSNTSVGVDRLTSHLRSEDFFATEDYPTATFSVTSVNQVEEGYEVTGDLTIKGEINEVTFPATAGMVDEEFVLDGSTVIDRTDWGIRFRSPSFFSDIGDNAIADEVEVSFRIVGQVNN